MRLDRSPGEETLCSIKITSEVRDSEKDKEVLEKGFLNYTIGELQELIRIKEKGNSAEHKDNPEEPYKLPEFCVDISWIDAYEKSQGEEDQETGQVLILENETEEKAEELLNLNWKSDPEEYLNKKWVKVKSVMDSGASAPVAPPSMMPSVKIEPSEGSKRGQKYSSASKHKIKNLGQQHLKACTEQGDETEVLFQIADISKPLVSVSAICEKGNRVIFGRAGGVVQNLATGKLIPFQRENGIYVLSLWLEDTSEGDFHRP